MEQYLSEIITALVSVAVSYGAMKAEIRNMKQKIDRYDKDHDLLVRIDEKVSAIIETQRKLEELREK